MKKNIFILLVLMIPFLLTGCNKETTLENNMSEITKIYFTAQTDKASANISVGEREEFYIIDGKHGKNLDFSLISLKFENLLPENQIEVKVNINNVSTNVLLELNPANHYYMADLGYKLNENDNISLNYKDITLNFENVSQDFEVDYNQALKIAKEELGDNINNYYQNSQFKGEGYLRILAGQDEENQGLFWVLTIVGENGQKNDIVISVIDGKVIIND